MMTQVLMTSLPKRRKVREAVVKVTGWSLNNLTAKLFEWKTYLNQFEVCVQHNKWDDNEKIAYLRWAMTGQAAQLLWRTEGFTYRQLIRKLEHRFGSDRIHEKFQHELRCRRRGKHETLPELAQDVQRLMS